MPAFMAAVAASECGDEADMVRVLEGEWVREVPLEGEACGEGGRVLRSGGMVGGWACVGAIEGLGLRAQTSPDV